jgi:hypothetical protein
MTRLVFETVHSPVVRSMNSKTGADGKEKPDVKRPVPPTKPSTRGK